MKITVIGTGYVGIVTAVVFADFGNQVVGLDIDPKRVDALKKAKTPIHEPQLEEFLGRGLQSGRLTFTTSYKDALIDTEVVFICVGTPQADTGEVDLRYVEAATESIAKHLKKAAVIVLKSTVPPGVHRRLKKIIDQHIAVDYEFASVPEFLREGSAIADTLNPNRIVLGVSSKKASDLLLDLHKALPGERIITDIISAQMIKYAANAFLATKISFANAIARLCDLIGADVQDVMIGIGSDPRIGSRFLNPGLGFGGSCFPKDIKGLYHISQDAGYELDLIRVVDEINQSQVDYVIRKMEKKVGSLKGKTVGLLGLAFKPNTDDMREARSIPLISALVFKGATVRAYDPIAKETAKVAIKESIDYVDSAYEVANKADMVVLVTEWDEFKDMDFEEMKKRMKGNFLVDGRNLFDPKKMKALGFDYIGIGRN